MSEIDYDSVVGDGTDRATPRVRGRNSAARGAARLVNVGGGHLAASGSSRGLPARGEASHSPRWSDSVLGNPFVRAPLSGQPSTVGGAIAAAAGNSKADSHLNQLQSRIYNVSAMPEMDYREECESEVGSSGRGSPFSRAGSAVSRVLGALSRGSSTPSGASDAGSANSTSTPADCTQSQPNLQCPWLDVGVNEEYDGAGVAPGPDGAGPRCVVEKRASLQLRERDALSRYDPTCGNCFKYK